MTGSAQTCLVSIVLTTLNGARYLTDAIDSCLDQTYRNIELIVVDGGSTDGTLDILARYDDSRLQIIHQQGNVGKLPGAINLGLEHARGDYLTWMQDDCVYQLDAIETMVNSLDTHPEIGQVYADFWEITEAGTTQRVMEMCEPEEILHSKSDLVGVCFLIRRNVREVVGPHDVAAYPTQDYDYRLRIAQHFSSLRIRQPLFFWRLHAHSLTGSHSWAWQARNDVHVRLRLGISNRRQARIDLAQIDMAYAFDCFQAKQWREVPALVWSGVLNNPRFIVNRGVWSILARSVYRLTAV